MTTAIIAYAAAEHAHLRRSVREVELLLLTELSASGRARASVPELAAHLGLAESTITTAIRTLVREGLWERCDDRWTRYAHPSKATGVTVLRPLFLPARLAPWKRPIQRRDPRAHLADAPAPLRDPSAPWHSQPMDLTPRSR